MPLVSIKLSLMSALTYTAFTTIITCSLSAYNFLANKTYSLFFSAYNFLHATLVHYSSHITIRCSAQPFCKRNPLFVRTSQQ